MKAFWDDLKIRVKSGEAGMDEQKLYGQIGKAMAHLSRDPRYPGLNSGE